MDATATATSPGPSEVDAAVRAVLAPLLARRASAPTAVPGVATFEGKLLSLRLAEAFGPGIRVVAVGPGTVVTPLARDHLRRLGVEVRLGGTADTAPRASRGDWGFVIESRSGVVEAVRRSWLDGDRPWAELPGTADDAAAWVAADRDRGALVLTDLAALVVYRACQVPGVRAASAVDAESVALAVRSLGVNLLAVEPAGKPIGLLRQIGAAFRRAGAPAPPAGFEATIGGRP